MSPFSVVFVNKVLTIVSKCFIFFNLLGNITTLSSKKPPGLKTVVHNKVSSQSNIKILLYFKFGSRLFKFKTPFNNNLLK